MKKSSSFNCSYLEINTKINLKDFIKTSTIIKDSKTVKGKQYLTMEDKNKIYDISNRDLLGSKCKKVELKDFYIGKFI